ncbi:hybrid sensor histidine kinase/response regulator [Gloeobacter kilaueensis]|uniref:histidine kinase n=1 Tax=Gloeobacter kilaueensis (strain ATCC BAA-2537 / CCAP 1431/1 / ULC 316 / JS1) TaxID=1183438 RepID=U5QHV2_GLOK1|nr:ATP-binding protein [Gloeobacter kilaueensis]AGY58501.1 response regulator receiver sensor signal transduction histidine kinase [Gloeobacter kilaueensis JS1]
MSASILIVEDERLVAEDLRISVESFGYYVCDIVGSGELAVERCNQLHPDLALMDIQLKGSLNGIAAAQQICQKNDVAVVFLTAFCDAQFLEQAQTVLPYGYLLKPYNENELRAMLQMALYKHTAEKQIREQQQRLNAILSRLNDPVVLPSASQSLQVQEWETGAARKASRAVERKALFDGLLQTLAHELRTPLLASRLTLRSLMRGAFGPVDQALQEVLSESEGTNEELIKMVETLLEISRYETGAQFLLQEPLDWHRLSKAAIEGLRATFGCEPPNIHCRIEPVPAQVIGDPQQIVCLLRCLLDNALRASGPGDSVELSVELLPPRRVKVSVSDQGQGIAPSVQKQLFKKFLPNRRRGWGAGLSLYLCNRIVQAHGGTIAVNSTPGSGSTFYFTLPLAGRRR